jgi:transmembrane protein 216
MITTLVLQICLYFSGVYLTLFAVAEFSLQIYKWVLLPYSMGTLISELVLFLLLIIVESLRIQLGKRGNLTNETVPLVASLLLIAPSLLAVLYW